MLNAIFAVVALAIFQVLPLPQCHYRRVTLYPPTLQDKIKSPCTANMEGADESDFVQYSMKVGGIHCLPNSTP